MPLISSPLGTSGAGIPAVNATEIGKFAGLHMHFATLSALNAAVAIERANVLASSAMWQAGQLFTVAAESLDVYRFWSVAGNHARTLQVRPGLTVVFPTDASTVIFGAGAPGAAVGVDGDLSIDFSGSGKIFSKMGGTWSVSLASIYTSTAIAAQEPSVDLPDANAVLAPGTNANVLTYSNNATARTHTFANNGWTKNQEVTIECMGSGAVTVSPPVGAAVANGVAVVGNATLPVAGAQYDTMQFLVVAATANTVTFKRRA